MDNIAHSTEKIVTVNGSIQLNYDTFGEPEDPAILLIIKKQCINDIWEVSCFVSKLYR